MKPPVRLRDRDAAPGTPEAESARLVVAARSTVDWSAPDRGRLWRRIERSASRPRRRARWLMAAALVPAFALAIVVARWPRTVENPPSDWQALDVGAGSDLEISPGARLRRVDPSLLQLDGGRLRGRIAGRAAPLVVVTPKLRLQVGSARFFVEVLEGSTTVTLDEGTAEAISPTGGNRSLHPGETLRSDDPRLLAVSTVEKSPAAVAPRPPIAPVAPAPPVDGCRTLRAAARRDCYLALAGGDDLAAQNALYLLGLLERDDGRDAPAAIRTWRAYQTRFPRGALAAEVSLAILDALAADHHPADACREAERYLADFPGDGRAAEVSLLRARLLRESLHDLPAALPAYRAVADQPTATATQREEALFLVGVCQQELGLTAEARATWRKCRASFPSGAHARELDHLLAR